METTTFKCTVCDWIGSTPARFCVNSGLSCNPVRYLCPECSRNRGKYSSIELYHIVPREEYYSVSNPRHLYEGYELSSLLNSPKGLENRILNDDLLRCVEKPSRWDKGEIEIKYRKADVDKFIKAINAQLVILNQKAGAKL
jgi:hypothetical protein